MDTILASPTKTMQVACLIRDEIASLGLKSGARLLAARQFAEKFSVSKQVVQSAFSILEKEGIVETRGGGGTYVMRPPMTENGRQHVSKLVGFICHGGLENAFMASIASGIEELANAEGIQLCVGGVTNGPTQEAELIGSFVRRGVDGIIISPVESNPPSPYFLELCRSGMNMVAVDALMPGVGVAEVACDDREGGFIATERLIKAGHKRIAHICGPRLVRNSHDRFEGYCRALEANRIPFDPELARFDDDEWGFKDGAKAAQRLLDLPEVKRPTAIFLSNDFIALEVWKVLKERGISVPQDLSLIGYGNVRAPYEQGLFLTSVDQQPKSIGRNAWALLKRLLDGDASAKSARLLLKPELVERGSVSQLKGEELKA